MKKWLNSGTPWIWLTASAVTVNVVIVAALVLLIAIRGLGHFWPAAVLEAQYSEAEGQTTTIIGEIHDEETLLASHLPDYQPSLLNKDGKEANKRITRYLLKTGNRQQGLDFRWVFADGLQNQYHPADVLVTERREWGNFYGYLQAVKENGQIVSEGPEAWAELQRRIDRARQIFVQVRTIEKHEIGKINYAFEQLRLQQRRLELAHDTDPLKQAVIASDKAALQVQFAQLTEQLLKLQEELGRDSFSAKTADGQVVDISLAKVVRVYRPNSLSLLQKCQFYFTKLWEFTTDEPREANTEGGIFPAIFGTVIMVFIMSIIVTPFGVVAAVYLHEYAKQGLLTRVIRIAVNNLAGVPSIVYGVFGLGFFVYFIGSHLDQWFFPEALPSPTFGTGGIFWAAVTLALLTLPVVIVSTEEGLSRIPSSIREGSLALGATKAETLWRTVLPMASPAMMTGLILAIARAAGEVAPLMLVGVVKLAPSLVLDGNYPFLHLERKFMHLGFHIYDVGFQSPNVEAARPLVYMTSFLLVTVIITLNLTAIWIRNHLREKYKALETA
ncbi:MAG: phosphate ABC transporter, permease protein PstA [Beggiatoa sp. IS2]|nr:MAG: phosphate ABC transporter, permease protein PstA [Beggiatoa sp. IS2]